MTTWAPTPRNPRQRRGMVKTRPIIDPAATAWERGVAQLWFGIGRTSRSARHLFDWADIREGSSRDPLIDIESRFAFAERTIKKVPTGIRWSEAVTDVDTLRWEAAQQALRLDSVEAEWSTLRWGDAGSPARVLADQLGERRARHLGVLRAIQKEADALARVAGNALAASRVALAATGGNLRALDAALPSVEAIAAAGRLTGTRARLEALTAAWISLDASGELALGQASRPELHPPRRRRRRGR